MADPLQFALSILEMRERTAQRDREFAALKQQREFENSLAKRQDQRQQTESDLRVKAAIDGRNNSLTNTVNHALLGKDPVFIPEDTPNLTPELSKRIEEGESLEETGKDGAKVARQVGGGRLFKVQGGYQFIPKDMISTELLAHRAVLGKQIADQRTAEFKTATEGARYLKTIDEITRRSVDGVDPTRLKAAIILAEKYEREGKAAYEKAGADEPAKALALGRDTMQWLSDEDAEVYRDAMATIGASVKERNPSAIDYTDQSRYPDLQNLHEGILRAFGPLPTQQPARGAKPGAPAPAAPGATDPGIDQKRARMNDLKAQLRSGRLGPQEQGELRSLIAELKSLTKK